jgi:nicotinamide mononucleotide transporter
MYAVKSLHATAGLYLVFVGLAAMGLRAWKKAGAQDRMQQPVSPAA